MRQLLLAFLALTAFASGAFAQQEYPSKPIRIVIPFTAGGPTDLVARKLSERLGQRLGQTVIVENKPGGATLLGLETVMRAPADGYTALITATQIVQLPALTKVPYDVNRDFLPVALICSVPLVLTVNAQLPVKDVKEFVEYLRTNA